MEYPHVDLPVDIIAWDNVDKEILNLYKQSCRLKACIFALCLEGNFTVSINLIDMNIKPNDFVTLLPGTIIQFHNPNEKVRLCFIGFSEHCVNGINLLQTTLSSFSNIMESPVINLNPTITAYYSDYIALIARVTTGPHATETIWARKILELMLYGTNKLYANWQATPKSTPTRGESICRKLIKLVIEHYTNERTAQFYADKLGISLQYLSTTVKQTTGRNVLDIIAYVVIIDAKSKLKSTDMTVQEIAYSLNFPSPSFFGKYFKRHVGMSPLEYKNS